MIALETIPRNRKLYNLDLRPTRVLRKIIEKKSGRDTGEILEIFPERIFQCVP